MTVKVFLKKKLGDRASQLKRDTASKAEATQSSGENVEPVLKPSSDGKASGPSETDQRPSPKGVNGGTGVERTDVSSHAEVSSQRRESGQLNKPSDPYHETTQSYVEVCSV